jgi:hypothetical protein
MDHTDDARLVFEANDAEALAKVEARFKALVGGGFTPARSQVGRRSRIARSFDPSAQETLFYPRLVGG